MKNENLVKNNLQGLTEIFRRAGASDPQSWASSQINEGINQLGRLGFLKSITSEWLKDDDLNRVDGQIQYNCSNPGNPCSQLSKALKGMIDKNVSRKAMGKV